MSVMNNGTPTRIIRVALERSDLLRRYLLASILTIVQLSWFAVMAFTAIAKIVESGVLAYISHFTNWSWTLQIFFYGATAAGPFIILGLIRPDGLVSYFTQAVIVLLFFPLLGIVVTVMVVISVLLATNSPFLIDIFEQIPPGLVVLGNELFHSIPVLALILHYTLAYKLVHYAHNGVIAGYRLLDQPLILAIFIGYQAYFFAAIALTIYSLLFDPRVIYETDLPLLAGVVVAFASLTAILIVVMVVLALFGVASRRRYSYAWLWRNDAAQDLAGGVIIV